MKLKNINEAPYYDEDISTDIHYTVEELFEMMQIAVKKGNTAQGRMEKYLEKNSRAWTATNGWKHMIERFITMLEKAGV